MKFIPLLLLSACAATGQPYHGQSTIIYRQPILANENLGYASLSIGGKSCHLAANGFMTVNTKEPTQLVGSKMGTFSDSVITVSPGDYVKVTLNYDAIYSGLFHMKEGPYYFTKVPAKQARQELQGLKEDCI